MATLRFLVCKQCGSYPARGPVFRLLHDKARGMTRNCPICNGPTDLKLKFDFGLNAPYSECTVKECFIPRKLQSWPEKEGSRVTFYPFLVLVHRHGKKLAVWLPYWHVVKRPKQPQYKYGQWAPFMDTYLFSDLLQQAHTKGYLTDCFNSGAVFPCVIGMRRRK